MQLIAQRPRGLTVLMDLNWDRLLYLATVALALGAGAWIGAALN